MIWVLGVVGTFIAVTVSSGLAGRYGKGWLFAIYAVSIVIANVTASKLMTVFGLTVAATDVLYTYGAFPLIPVTVGQYIIKIVVTLINVPFAYLAHAVFHWSTQSQPRVPSVTSSTYKLSEEERK